MPLISDEIKKIIEAGNANALPKEIIEKAYREIFNMNLCTTCGSTDWQGAVNSIINYYNKKISNMSAKKNYKWNLNYKGIALFINGARIVVGEKCEQSILEIIYNDPNRSGLVIAESLEDKGVQENAKKQK